MKKYSFLIAISLIMHQTFTIDFLDLTKYNYEQYQDIIINGKVVKAASGEHETQSRYAIIKTILDKYKRPFTLLDIGASQGYFSFKAAYDYDVVCVMIEGNNPAYPMVGSQLLDLCKLNTSLDNIILLNKKVIHEDLQLLSECEHFDVILAFNIIHWFDNDWKKVTNAILNMGDNVIIETPPQEEVTDSYHNKIRKDIEDYLHSKNATIIGTVKRHTSNTRSNIYLIQTNKQYLQRKTWLKPILNEKNRKIDSTFEEKTLTKKVDWPADTYITSNWQPGINLLTFKMYNGTYPLKNTIKESIRLLKNIETNDWMPNNMIIQGKNITMIDCNDPTHGPGGPGGGCHYSNQHLNKIYKLIDADNPTDVEKVFANLHK